MLSAQKLPQAIIASYCRSLPTDQVRQNLSFWQLLVHSKQLAHQYLQPPRRAEGMEQSHAEWPEAMHEYWGRREGTQPDTTIWSVYQQLHAVMSLLVLFASLIKACKFT